MKKTNINDLISLDKKFIDVDEFECKFNKGLCFVFNGRESFFGYYSCINKVVEYINNELASYDIISKNGDILEDAKVTIYGYEIYIEILNLKYNVGFISEARNKILTFNKFAINKNSYKKGNSIVYELFFSWEIDEEQTFIPIGSFVCDNYNEYLNSNHWKNIRKIKIEESGCKCQLCGSYKNLNVHHNNYDNLFMEDMNDLIVLCESCHKKFHDIV